VPELAEGVLCDALPEEVGASAVANTAGSSLRSSLRGASITLITSVLSIGIGVVTNTVLARLLGPECKGRVDLMNSTIGLTSMLAGSALGVGVTYVVAKGQTNHRRLALILATVAVLQGAATWLVLAAIAHTPQVAALIPSEYRAWGAPLVGVATCAALLLTYWRSFLLGLHRFATSALLDVGGKLLTAALMIGAVIALRHTPDQAATAAVVGIAVAYALASLVAGVTVVPQFRGTGVRSGFAEVCRYTLPCYCGYVVQSLNYRLDVLLVAYYVGVQAVAQYVIAVAVAQLLWLPTQAMQSVLFPRLTAMSDPGERAAHAAQVARLLFAMTLPMSLGVALAGPWVVLLLFGAAFRPSIVPLWALLPGVSLFAVTNILASFMAAIGRPSVNLAIATVALVPTIGLNVWLLPRIGILGAAIASSASYATSAALVLWAFRQYTQCGLRTTVLLTRADLLQLAGWLRTYAIPPTQRWTNRKT
jgi:O-antigen/teichoic acid export membrane protein